MNSNTTRAFAFGLLLASALLFIYKQFFHVEQVSKKAEIQSGYIEIKKSEYAALKKDVEHWQSQYEELIVKQEKLEGKKTAEKEDEGNDPVPVHYLLTISAGMSSNDISQQLVKVGIINDEKEFNDYLADKDLQRYIQVGTYELTTAMDMKEIANIITKKKAGS